MEQMAEEYVEFCADLARDGHIGYPAQFVQIMWEWESGDGEAFRLEDMELAINFLRTHKLSEQEINQLVEWMRVL
jgi:hypothetical protein